MKNKTYQLTAIIFVLFVIISFSCRKPSMDEDDNNYLNAGYEKNEAAEIMTLAAICYTADGNSAEMIKDSIIYLLGNTELATAGNWELAWGPGISDDNTNLIYVAKNPNTDPVTYAIAIRGTSIYSIKDILQDIKVFELVPFKYGLSGDSVAEGSMEGLDILLETEDMVTGKKIGEYLSSISGDEKKKMYITGHSQGGALAPLMTYWFITTSGLIDKFYLETYAFAGPSVTNAIFKENFFNTLPETAHFHMVANSLDAVPYFWARYDSLVTNDIPAPVPLVYRILITILDETLKYQNIKYKQLDNQISIGCFTPKDTIGDIHPSDTLAWYNHWMLAEHRHNNYLRLLNAEPTK